MFITLLENKRIKNYKQENITTEINSAEIISVEKQYILKCNRAQTSRDGY